ncbi:RICIN domain-containing protein [Streptosporangium sp. NPDC051022]|uniref:RICIN domain-containing protein n=1 Tax=Streptosporangium sp. NPDC051022 TaxID=3155752 RepID=UPI0034170097
MAPVRAVRTVALVAVLLAGPLALPAAAAPAVRADGSPARAGAIFTANLIARQSDRCLSVSTGSTRNGSPAIQWDCGSQLDQLWRMVSMGGGFYHLRATHSSKCLSVANGSTEDGAVVIQWECGPQYDQQWKLVQKEGGFFAFVARHSGKCLSVYDGSAQSGASVIQWECGTQHDQQWKFA